MNANQKKVTVLRARTIQRTAEEPENMKVNEKFGKMAGEKTVSKTVEALEANGFTVLLARDKAEAKKMALGLIPMGASVMTMTSKTLETAGITGEINESGKFDSIRKKFEKMDRQTQFLEMQRMGAAPEWAIGSSQAVTQKGEILFASRTGSQLPAYASGAPHVIWVIGTQKIVPNLQQGFKRIQEYCLPLENERAQKAYGTGSGVSKILLIKSEIRPGRATIILVKEKIGF